ncbi:hypothetical protein [Thiosulfativibrio zosterae]|uniref:Lipid A biosynthesis lauroyl acyltransferase n=1 Tax=Thiosulfativibrio zosterae TaxID=2675053 RepID=A0A6F8PQK3_9GAMM|nr:hypothetical protein [Thiosulfativibrio zosterae]BBP44308.1 hypothetical protein THMIRHAT_20540 [Thiosulfativibrio zosterae]
MKLNSFVRALKLRAILPALKFLPKNWAYPIASYIGYKLFFIFEKEWVNQYREGIQNFYAVDFKTAVNWTKLHFQMLAREEMDSFFYPKIKVLDDFKHISYDANFENDLKEFKEDPNGKIIIMSHFGRPLSSIGYLGLHTNNVGMLSQAVDQTNPHLDPTTRTYLNYKMQNVARISGGQWFKTNQNPILMYKALKNKESIVIMFDIPEGDISRQIRPRFEKGFLKVAPGIVRLARKTHANLYYAENIDNGNSTICRVIKLSNEPETALSEAAEQLSKTLRDKPWLWWQWNIINILWEKE